MILFSGDCGGTITVVRKYNKMFDILLNFYRESFKYSYRNPFAKRIFYHGISFKIVNCYNAPVRINYPVLSATGGTIYSEIQQKGQERLHMNHCYYGCIN